MKQHIYQIILFVVLIAVITLVFQNTSFFSSKTKGISEPMTVVTEQGITESVTAEEPREALFRKLSDSPTYIAYTATSSNPTPDGPRLIVSGGVAKNPDYFYSEPSTTSKLSDVDLYLQNASSSGSKATYSTSTGSISVITRTGKFAPKDHIDQLTNTYISEKNDIGFKIDETWSISDKTGLIAIQNVGKYGKNKIVISIAKTAVVKTSDATRGDFILSYRSEDSSWVKGVPNTEGNIDFVKISPDGYTMNGDPIFVGTTKRETRVIALEPSLYIIVNINGGDDTSIIDGFVETFSYTK
ncbi:MAG: hypothetical protein FGM57_01780 [Candidatus Taylorbacteria bacterium]|nr:hypothetical protein [Candidatus Taylorbacteria bacterium]